MQRYDIIKYLIKKHDFKSYLEIGVLGRETLNQINVPIKHGVDPNGQGNFTMTSDEFFANYCSQKYDLIFIDGLHLAEQVKKDIENSLTVLNENGIIVVHDCLPTEEWHQLRQGVSGQPWTGDSWRAFATLRAWRTDLKMFTIDTDWGCGIIKRQDTTWEPRVLIPNNGWTWEDFKNHRDEIMNVVTVEEFLNGCT